MAGGATLPPYLHLHLHHPAAFFSPFVIRHSRLPSLPSRANLPTMHEPAPFQAAGRLIDFMRQADEPGLINLAAGVPGLDALPRVQLEEAFRRAFAHDGSAMLAYHHPEGDHELRELLAARLRARGAAVEASGV